ncbi:MAG: PAS domain S-box protein, partial [Chloroflexi bacterium]|nr:PAS domain S-box protein [Chloroflexota bacterium]
MAEDATSQEDTAGPRRARRASLAPLWQRLTQPHPSIRKSDRRRARLLSALLLALISLGLLAIALTVSTGPALLFVPVPAVVVLCCAYGLSRTRHYALAATLTVATVGGSVIAVSIANPDSPVLNFMVLAVMLSSLLLSLPATVFVFGAAVAADVILRALLPGLPPPQFISALYDLFTLGALLILAAAVRQRDQEQIERQNRKLSQEVAERKQTEAALHESEERYRSLAEAAPDMVFIIGRDDRVEYVNRAAATQFGVGPEEVIGRPRETLFPPQIAEAQKQSLQQVFTGGRAARRETAAVFRDTVVWLDTSLVPLLDEAGSVRAVLGISRDVTERKQAEGQLRLITTALEATANGVVITDPTGAILWVNPAFTTLTGYASAEALGKNPRDLVKSGQHSREFYGELWQTIASGRAWQGETINRRKDGSLYDEEQTITPVRNERGEITHFIAIKVDNSDHKRREEALRQSEERFLSAFESAAIGMALVALDGHWLKVNRVLCDIVGYSAQELMTKTFLDITHPDDLTTHLDYTRQLLAGEIRTYQIEKRYFHKSGRVVWILLSVSLVRDHDGHPTHYISQTQDITERKRGDLLRQALFHIGQAAVTTESLDDLYRSIHAALAGLIHVENFYIALYDPAGDRLSFPYFVDQVDQPDPPKKPGRGLTEYVLRTGRTLLADPDTFEHLVQQGEVELIGAPGVDWLGVPLTVEDRLAGVMVVQSYTEGVRFTQADAQVLEFVSTQVAGAIERKRSETALGDANQFSHEVISSAAEGIIVYDREMRYLVWNRFMEDLTGLPAEQVLGKHA